MKKDPRVQRTRRQLHEALLALIAERGYDAVTVQDVLDRAQVARSSFYAHFHDKEDLLLAGFVDAGGSLQQNLFAADGKLGLPLFQHVEQYKPLAKVLLGAPSGNPIVEHMRNVLVVQAREWLSSATPAPGVPTEPVVQYLVNALLGMLVWWVRQDFPHSAEEMGAQYHRLALTGLTKPSG